MLPPLRALVKSSEVEDPVNVYVHRPLAYAFVRSVYRTPITPNAVTFLAMVVGIAAGASWLYGTPGAMVAGGLLLWTSAILDGADGILARAKNMQSQFGRALDGASDMIVAAATVIPAFIHLYRVEGEILHLWLAVPAILLTLVHLYLYDFYKESFLRWTRLDRGGEGEDAADVESRLRGMQENLGMVTRLAVTQVLLPFLRAQSRLVAMTNPNADATRRPRRRSPEAAEIYRAHNQGPMRLWAAISLAPHSYLLAICGMFDRIDVYLWVRLFAMNAIFLVVVLWQRRASRRSYEVLAELDAV